MSVGSGCEQLDRALHGRVDRLGRHPVAALDERTELVDHRAVAPRLQHVQERLRGQDLADRRCKRWPASFRADTAHLLENVQEPVGGGMGAQMHLERCDEPCGKVVLGGTDGDSRSDGSDRLVPDVLVDDVRGFPQLVGLDARAVTQPLERLGQGLSRDPVETERERIHGGCDEVGSRLHRRERRGDAEACRPLDVEAHGEPARVANPLDELMRLVREEGSRGVVDDDARRAELRELSCLLDEPLGLVRATGAVDEARVERAARAGDRGTGFAKVGDIVQRIVESEDLDAVLRGTGDEAPHDVAADRARTRPGSGRAARSRAVSTHAP